MKWNYHFLPLNYVDCGKEEIIELGKQGWELFSIKKDDAGGYVFFFKKPYK